MFNPCGCWSELLSTFYSMPAIVYVAGVPTTVTIRWYKAPAGAQAGPFPTAIFSHVWDNNPGESVDGEVGEVGRPRTWDKGLNPGYQGKCFRGDPAWFASGQVPALNTIPASTCLCQIAPAEAAGGLVLAGAGVVRQGSKLCSQCPNGTAAAWDLACAGGTGLFAPMNGTTTLPKTVIDCDWSFNDHAGHIWDIGYGNGSQGPGWYGSLQVAGPGGLFPIGQYFAAPFTCWTPVSMTLYAYHDQVSGSTPPNSIAIAPHT